MTALSGSFWSFFGSFGVYFVEGHLWGAWDALAPPTAVLECAGGECGASQHAWEQWVLAAAVDNLKEPPEFNNLDYFKTYDDGGKWW